MAWTFKNLNVSSLWLILIFFTCNNETDFATLNFECQFQNHEKTRSFWGEDVGGGWRYLLFFGQIFVETWDELGKFKYWDIYLKIGRNYLYISIKNLPKVQVLNSEPKNLLGWLEPLVPNACGLELKNWVSWWGF